MGSIQARALSKVYRVHQREAGIAAALRSLVRRKTREVVAVSDLSFEIASGERVGFLGPNGAGKTTTLKVLSGLLHPSQGEVRVAGHTPQDRSRDFLSRITLVMGQKQQLLWDVPAAETFLLQKAIYDLPEAQFRETLRELDDLLELGELTQKPARQLSLGERMKCELAAALLHRPQVLFLDEPTIGLDVSMQAALRDFVRGYNERFGATVLLTSHYMQDVAALCPRVIVIDKGRLVFDGQLAELVRTVQPDKRVQLRFSRKVDAADLNRLGRVIESDEVSATLQVPLDRLQGSVSQALAHLPLLDLTVADPPLEEVMRELFERARRERPSAA